MPLLSVHWTTVTILVSIGMAGPTPIDAQSAEDGEPVIAYRKSIMQAFLTHGSGVRAALDGNVPMDHAAHHAIALRHMAESLANVFPEGSMSPVSRALPSIWDRRAEFLDLVSTLQGATATLEEASATGDAAAIAGALDAVQGTCGDCHSSFRARAR